MNKFRFIFLLLCISFPLFLKAQLIVNTNRSANDLVKNVLASKGVSISAVNSSSNLNAIGFFNGTRSNIGLDSGILLSTGSAIHAIGPNQYTNRGSSNNQPGDSDILELFPSELNYDAAWIEFTVVPESDILKFRFVFGSEEYPESLNKNFNDVFGLFIQGQGYPVKTNLALIPGTNIPVSINTVNSNSNAQYYVDNTNGTSIEFDGFTTVMEVEAKVVPCKEYTLKFVIADVKDLMYDSGIFIEAQSLQSVNKKAVSMVTSKKIINECEETKVIFQRKSDDVSQELIVNYQLQGDAINGIDYIENGNGQVVIPVGASAAQFIIKPLYDQIAENTERIIIAITNPLFCDTLKEEILLYDYKKIDTFSYKFSCENAITRVTIVEYPSLDSVKWYDENMNFIQMNYQHEIDMDDTTWYYIKAIEKCTGEEIFDSVRIYYYKLTTNVDTIICANTPLSLFVKSDLPGAKYEWESSIGSFSPSPFSINPTIRPGTSGLITVRITNDGVCAEKTFFVNVIKLQIEFADISICGPGDVQLKASGGTKYKWIPSTYLDNDTIAEPISSALSNINYQVQISNLSCTETFGLSIKIDTTIITKTIDDKIICSREFVQLNAQGSPTNSYEWYPVTGLDNPLSPTPMANPLATTTYVVKGINGACFSFDSVTVFVVDSVAGNISYSYDSCSRYFIASNPFADDRTDIIWDMGDGTSYTGKSIQHRFSTPGNFTVTQKNNTIAPCKTEATIQIKSSEIDISKRKIPSSFSPNNDGINDVFKVSFGNTNCKINRFQIFNRWGQRVFDHSVNNTFEWDGKSNGIECQQGAYVYIIDGDGFQEKGIISLIR